MTRAAAGAAIVAAALLYAADGPLWRLAVSSSVPEPLRGDVARLRSWRGSTRAAACRRLAVAGAAAAPYLVDHTDDTGWADGLWAGASRVVSFHSGARLVSVEAIQSVESIGRDAVPAVITGLQSPREGVRMAAADILGEMRDARSVPPLRAAADHDPSPSVRNHAIDSLAGMCDAAVIADTRARLHAADEWQRAAAVHRLGRCNSPETVETLRDVLLDPAQPVAAEAESALRRLGSVR